MEQELIEKKLRFGMIYTFREYMEVKPLTEEKIKELAREMRDRKVAMVTKENINQIPLASFLVSSFIENEDFGNQNIVFVATIDQGLCGSMRVVLSDDWNKAIEIYQKAMEMFD